MLQPGARWRMKNGASNQIRIFVLGSSQVGKSGNGDH